MLEIKSFKVDEPLDKEWSMFEARKVLGHIKTTYPDAKMLVGGSVAFLHHYPEAENDVKLNDVDVSVIIPPPACDELHQWAVKQGYKIVSMHGDDKVIIPFGNVDVHLGTSLDYNKEMAKLLRAQRYYKYDVYIMSKSDIGDFYRTLNRDKDKTKLRFINN